MKQNTLIIAANGRVASRVVARLDAAGHQPAVLVRDGAKARRLLTRPDGNPMYRDLFVGELSNRDTLASALRRADVAFLALGSSLEQVTLEKSVIDAARDAHLAHLVKLSSAHASHDAVSSVLQVHAEIEDHLTASGVEHTLISPTSFMDLVLIGAPSIRTTANWVGTAPNGANALIDSEDVVDAITAVLGDPSKRGGTHVLTGPEALTWPDVAAALTALTGRTVTYQVVSIDERRAQLVAADLADWRVDLLLGIDELNRHAVYVKTTDTVRALTGQQPRHFADFIERHRSQFDAAPAGTVTA